MPEQSQLPVTNTTSYSKPLDADFSKWLEQFNEELLLLEHDLRGDYVAQEANQMVWKASNHRLMNERGIRHVTGYLRSIANKNTYVSNLQNEDAVMRIALSATQTLTKTLFLNSDAFDLDINYFDDIIERCANICELALRRPMFAGEREFLGNTEGSVRSVSTPTQQPGLLGGIGGLFRPGGRRY